MAAPTGAGVGTPAALHSPACGPDGRLRVPYPYRPPCVVPWPSGADNGGATAPGVTADTIRVAFYYNPNGANLNGSRPFTDQFKYSIDMYAETYQLWGRKIQIVNIASSCSNSSNPDEACQRADALAIASAHPFVVCCTFASVIERELAKRGIMMFNDSGDAAVQSALAPYLWGSGSDNQAGELMLSELVCKDLAGRAASYAGDATMKATTRRFGVVYPNAGPTVLDPSVFLSRVSRCGVRPTVVAYNSDSTQASEEATVVMSKLKSAGVTTVVDLIDVVNLITFTKTSTQQAYFPEWLADGFGYVDYDLFGRLMDQNQWAHAFGLVHHPPEIISYNGAFMDTRFYRWYWGTGSNANSDAYNAAYTSPMGIFFSGIALAGPRLTVQSFRQGLDSAPALGGSSCNCVTDWQQSFGTHGYFPWEDFTSGDDWTLAYWSPTTYGDTQFHVFGDAPTVGAGKWRYLYEGHRFLPGHLPANVTFFNDSQSVASIPAPPPGEADPTYTCWGCPSTGGRPFSHVAA